VDTSPAIDTAGEGEQIGLGVSTGVRKGDGDVGRPDQGALDGRDTTSRTVGGGLKLGPRTDVRCDGISDTPRWWNWRHRGLKSLCTQVRAGSSHALGTASNTAALAVGGRRGEADDWLIIPSFSESRRLTVRVESRLVLTFAFCARGGSG
jgi:hypothetical protein